MSAMCEDVATLTTATVVTTSTVYVTTPTIAFYDLCYTHYTQSTSCPDEGQNPVTITKQIVQTQFRTLFGTTCKTNSTPAQSVPQTTTPSAPGITETTTTTQTVTITGTPPPDPTPTSSTSDTSSSSVSRNTVYTLASSSLTGEPDPTGTPIGAVSSPTSSGAIAGGVVGGVVLLGLLGLLAYFLISKLKSIFSPKGYQRPGGEELNDQYDGQSGWYPQTQDQGGYHTYGAGSGYVQQLQGSSMPIPPPQHTGQLQPQDFNGQNLYADTQVAGQGPGTQFWQQNMGFSAAALPAGAAAAVVVGHSPHPSISSAGSTAPLLVSGSRHHQQLSQGSSTFPYRGYAEPGP